MENRLVFEVAMTDGSNVVCGGPEEEHFIEILFIDKESKISKNIIFDPDACEIECWEEWGNTVPIAGITNFRIPSKDGNFLHNDRATLARDKTGKKSVFTMKFLIEEKVWFFEFGNENRRIKHIPDNNRIRKFIFDF